MKKIFSTLAISTFIISSNSYAANVSQIGKTIPCHDIKTNKIMLNGKIIGNYIKPDKKLEVKVPKPNKIEAKAKTIIYSPCPPPPFNPDKVVGFGARGRAKYGGIGASELYAMRNPKPQETHDFFVQWLYRNPEKFKEANQYLAYLYSQNVGNVVPVRELMLGCIINPARDDLLYDVPPRQSWGNIVPTLKFLKYHVIPTIGQLRLYHGYRSPMANLACGSSSDVHPNNMAIDIVPLKMDNPAKIEREMCKIYRKHGRKYNIGIGFYGTGLLHIDSWKTRSWGGDRSSGTSPCL